MNHEATASHDNAALSNWPAFRVVASVAAIVTASLLVAPVEAAPGDLDTTFGWKGTMSNDFNGDDAAADAVVDRAGRIIVVGTTSVAGISPDFVVARYHSNGRLDRTFGTDGSTVIDFGSVENASAVALQRDGKIVVAGFTIGLSGTHADFAVARLHADGSPDASFGSGGQVTTDFLVFSDFAFDLAIQRDGKIVLAGSARSPDGVRTTDFALARYRPDGTLDTSFGDYGTVMTDLGNSDFDQITAVAIQPDGKIVAIGYGWQTSGFALTRYNRDGSLDTTFDSDGKVTTDLGGGVGTDVAIQADGRIVALGGAFKLVRYRRDGTPDKTFGTRGVTGDLGVRAEGNALALQPDGKIVVLGRASTESGTNLRFAVARYEQNGRFDVAFGKGGRVLTRFGEIVEGAAVVLQPDGRIVAVGTKTRAELDVNYDFALLGYLSN